MMISLRLAFVLPAILIAFPATAKPTTPVNARLQREAPIRYATLDRMIRTFAARARAERAAVQEQAELQMERATVLAQR